MASPTPSVTEHADSSPTPSPYIDSWDEYFLEMAVTASRKSKDPRCQVGAIIVRENRIVSTGFNGLARDVFDDPSLLGDPEEKLRWICHAEQNAILNAARDGVRLQDTTIYVTKFPCLACCNAIVQAGIAAVYTHDKKFWDDDPADKDHSRKKSILRQAKIKVVAPFHPGYAAKLVTGKPASIRPENDQPAQSPSTESPKGAPRGKRGSKRLGKKAENLNLFPARRPIDGGKSET